MGVLTLRPFSQGELLGRPEGFVDWLYSDDDGAPGALPSCGRDELLRRALAGGQ